MKPKKLPRRAKASSASKAGTDSKAGTAPASVYGYKVLSRLVRPWLWVFYTLRILRHKEDPHRYKERRGRTHLKRPGGKKVLWFHAASIGEAFSLLSLLNFLLKNNPNFFIVLTTTTFSSGKIMEKRLPKGACHQYVPFDTPAYVRRFLRHWKPALAVWVESELWPNMIDETWKTGCPMALINARLSPASYHNWRKVPEGAAWLLQKFDTVLAQDAQSLQRLSCLGAKNITVTGSLKLDADTLPFNPTTYQILMESCARHCCWLAASTHSGEEKLVGQVHKNIKKTIPNLLTILVPRHGHRAADIAAHLRKEGLQVAQRSLKHAITKDTDIYLADTFGEMGLFYRLARAAFIGGTITNRGGQNPLEAVRLQVPVLHGPYTSNFKEIFSLLQEKGATRYVSTVEEFTEGLQGLLESPAVRQQVANNALIALPKQNSVMRFTSAALQNLLKKRKRSHR